VIAWVRSSATVLSDFFRIEHLTFWQYLESTELAALSAVSNNAGRASYHRRQINRME
jgi:hypothetical protein